MHHMMSHSAPLDPAYLSYHTSLHTAPIASPTPMLHSAPYTDGLHSSAATHITHDYQAAQSPVHMYHNNIHQQNGMCLLDALYNKLLNYHQLTTALCAGYPLDEYVPTMLANGAAASSPLLPQSHGLQPHDTTSLHSSHTYSHQPVSVGLHSYSMTGSDWRQNTDDYTQSSTTSTNIPQSYYHVPVDAYHHRALSDMVDSDADINPLNSGSSMYVCCAAMHCTALHCSIYTLNANQRLSLCCYSERVRTVRKKRKPNGSASKRLDMDGSVDLYNPSQTTYDQYEQTYSNTVTASSHQAEQTQYTALHSGQVLPPRHTSQAGSESIRRSESGKTIPEYALQNYPSHNKKQTRTAPHTDVNHTMQSGEHLSHSPDSESIESTDDDVDDASAGRTPSAVRRVSQSHTSATRKQRTRHRKRRLVSDDDSGASSSESEYELSSPATATRKRRTRKPTSTTKHSTTKLPRTSSTASSHSKTPRSNQKSSPPAGNDAIEPTVVCEQCRTLHTGWYGGGRFCTPKCARRFSIISRHSKRKSTPK